ncbi:response regulator transcription factor [Arcobacter sp.]|uniref:response regulator transcription factor n=1 Tax=Arcobacter sp. TaxID=1872629 RepID=UPI003D136FFE
MKILVLEDNTKLLNFIVTSLEKEGFTVEAFTDGSSVMEKLDEYYQCFILDINVPKVDGISILEKIRIKNPSIPVIIISSNHELDKIQSSYEIGCDEYLKKPFLMYELIHKVNKLCLTKKSKINLGEGFLYFPKDRYLTGPDGEIKLARKEILFLELLCKNRHQIFTFDEIEDYVWDGEFTNLTNIRGLVKRLRKKIPEDSIKIVKGIGYKINIE